MTSKGDIMINPLTQRPVRIGSKTWVNLVKKGLVEGVKDDNILFEELPEDQMEEKIKYLNQKLPQGTQAVRGRGKYASKIVKRQTPLTTEQITRNTVKKTAHIVADNMDEIDEMDSSTMEERLEKMIFEELMNTSTTRPKKKVQDIQSDEMDSEYSDGENESGSD